MAHISARRRRKYLESVKNKVGKLACAACCSEPLVIKHYQSQDIPLNKRATVDHIVAVSLGGSRQDLSNYQVLCEECNKLKGIIEHKIKIAQPYLNELKLKKALGLHDETN